MEDFSVRLAVLEEKQENLHSDISELKELAKDTANVVNELKIKIVQQNGAIPHMAESIKEIFDHQEKMMDQLKQGNSSETDVKVKLLWGLVTTLGAALLYSVLRLFVG